jgi:DHA1 family bicyclomycin/chloramphenicol resistance-like MFS transporter
VRPEAAGTASGAMGFLQQGVGALVSQLGAWLGGHSTTTLPLTAAIFALSVACAATMLFLVPRRGAAVSEEAATKASVDKKE